MMNLPLPQPPTDNLYKFKAISGLLIIVAIILLIALGFYQQLLSVKDYLAKDNLLRTEISAFWTDFNIDATGLPITKEEAEQSLKDNQNQNKIQTEMPFRSQKEFEHFLKNIYSPYALPNELIRFRNREDLERFRLSTKDFAVREAELNNAGIALIVEVLLKSLLLIIFYNLLNRGFKLMQKGFDEWYNKLQKYQDLVVRSQARDAMKSKFKGKSENKIDN